MLAAKKPTDLLSGDQKGYLAFALAEGAIMPNVSASISTIFSKISSIMKNASNTGS